MHYNKDGTFLTEKEFKNIKKSYELKNEKKEQDKRMGLWGWQKLPTTIIHWKKSINGLISIPAGLRGFYPFKDNYGVVNKVTHPNIINPYKGNKLDIKQDNFIKQLLKSNIGYGHCSTGIGKTVITAKIIKQLEHKTLIVVYGIELMNQMKDDLEEIFGEKYPTISGGTGIIKRTLIKDNLLEEKISKTQELILETNNVFKIKKLKKILKTYRDSRKSTEEINHKKLDKILKSNIVIVNIDTLVTLPSKEFFSKFDLTILDELDTYLGADRRREMIWNKINSKYIYGLTGTIKVNYLSDKVFGMYFGKKTELLEKHFNPDIYRVMTDFRYELKELKEFHKLKEELYFNEDRNNLIVNTVIKTIGNNKGILFSEYVEPAKILKEKLEDKGIKCFMLIGEIKSKERLEIKQQLKEYKGTCILIGSVKIIGRGFNLPELSVGYLTTAEKFKSNIQQYIGRIIRTFPGKKQAVWYDFIDPGCKILLGQAGYRKTTYKKEFPNSNIEFYE